jgi:hypothetical protein
MARQSLGNGRLTQENAKKRVSMPKNSDFARFDPPASQHASLTGM